VGIARNEVEAVQWVIKLVAQHSGKLLNNVGRVAGVEDEDEMVAVTHLLTCNGFAKGKGCQELAIRSRSNEAKKF
jgi:hypothetical protein